MKVSRMSFLKSRWCHLTSSVPPRVPSWSYMLPSAFRYHVLRHSTGVPLRPRTVIHGHLRVSALVGSQSHVARSHSRTAQDTHGTTGVHAGPDEELLEFVFGQEVTRRRQEGMEGDVDGAGDVAWLCVCQSEREGKIGYNNNNKNQIIILIK